MTPTEKRIADQLLTELEAAQHEPRQRAAVLNEYQTFLNTCILSRALAGKPVKAVQINLSFAQ
jgi:hypothetical protein